MYMYIYMYICIYIYTVDSKKLDYVPGFRLVVLVLKVLGLRDNHIPTFRLLLYVCMYVCMYVYICICMYTYADIHRYNRFPLI